MIEYDVSNICHLEIANILQQHLSQIPCVNTAGLQYYPLALCSISCTTWSRMYLNKNLEITYEIMAYITNHYHLPKRKNSWQMDAIVQDTEDWRLDESLNDLKILVAPATRSQWLPCWLKVVLKFYDCHNILSRWGKVIYMYIYICIYSYDSIEIRIWNNTLGIECICNVICMSNV